MYFLIVYMNNDKPPFLFIFAKSFFVINSIVKHKYIIFLIVSWIFFSCGDPHEYSVDAAFGDYVHRFETEADLRGHQINLQLSGLIIEFANLKDGKAGLCHYERPIRIEIDRSYWNQLSESANADLLKEDLIFHELGHGILNRRHTNEILENGDWKSMMCGGDAVENKAWNINYRGKRRNYYIDELFNQGAPLPDFMSMNLAVDTSGFKQLIHFGFDTNNIGDTGWDLKSITSYSISTENKQLKFVSKNGKSNAVMIHLNSPLVDIMNDILIEMDVNCIPITTSDQFGIALGKLNNGTDTLDYFKIDNQQHMYPGNNLAYGYYSQLSKKQIITNGYNQLKIIKRNNILHYFINDKYVYQAESELKGSGQNIGFIAPAYSTMYIDNVGVSVVSSSSTALKIPSNIQFSTEIIPLNSEINAFNK